MMDIIEKSNTNSGQPLEDNDFSLVMGGPLYQLFLRARITDPRADLLKRRMIVITLFAWIPLLVLSMVQGYALPGQIQVPFLYDIEVHVRFLVALPFLILSEMVVHKRIGPALKQFIQRNIIRHEERPRFDQILASTMKIRNSIFIELILILLVFTVGRQTWLSQLSLTTDTWYARIDNGAKHLTLPGHWFSFVSIPIVQFMLLRWYFRLLLWVRSLYLISKLDLHLIPTHPDHCGGLGFLGQTAYAFSTLLFAQGSLLSGLLANRIFFEGQKLTMFKMEIVALVLVAVLMVLIPLFIFIPKLLAAKRRGLGEYGLLASNYVREFEQKWIGGEHSPDEPLMGSADIQSLADLNNSFDVVREIRAVPFTRDTVIQLSVATLLPVAPLVLTMIPLEELVNRLIGVLV